MNPMEDSSSRSVVSRSGFAAPCPKCNEPAVLIRLDDLYTFSCAECGEKFSRPEIEAIVKEWSLVLRWLDMADQL